MQQVRAVSPPRLPVTSQNELRVSAPLLTRKLTSARARLRRTAMRNLSLFRHLAWQTFGQQRRQKGSDVLESEWWLPCT